MIDYLIYDPEGRIIQTGTIPDDMLHLQSSEGKTAIPGGADLDKDYVVEGRVTTRPSQRTELVASKLTGLPQPCTIYINGSVYPCRDEQADLEFTYPGSYTVRIEAFPYLNTEFRVTKT